FGRCVLPARDAVVERRVSPLRRTDRGPQHRDESLLRLVGSQSQSWEMGGHGMRGLLRLTRLRGRGGEKVISLRSVQIAAVLAVAAVTLLIPSGSLAVHDTG